MLTFNTLSAFKPQLKVNCKNAVTNPTMNKNIRFGESEDCGDSFYRHSGREGVEDKYNRESYNLADKADDIDMDNETYYDQKDRIERERDIALNDYDNMHR